MGTITLGKVDNLYWLGRYIERVYQSIIMYRKTYDTLIDQDSQYYLEECERMGITNVFENSRDFAWKIAFDTDNSLSILSNLIRAYDNGMIMRDEITSDTLAYIHLSLAEMRKAKVSEAPLIELQRVEDYILAFWGSVEDKVDNEEARNTVKVGKRIERIDILLRRKADRPELIKEMNRLSARIDSTLLPYDKDALNKTASMIKNEDSEHLDILYQLWNIVPPFL